MKVILFGAGNKLECFLKSDKRAKKIEIAAIMDNDKMKWGKSVEGYTILSPLILKEIEFDKIVITLIDNEICNEICKQLNEEYGIEKQKIIRLENLVMPAEINVGDMEFNCDYDQCYDKSEIIPNKLIPKNKLEDFFLKKTNRRRISKWLHYFEIYNRYFEKYIGKNIKMLEIGVFEGGSLQMWKEYFGKRARIYGIDINFGCKKYEEDQINILVGSQGDREFLNRIGQEYGKFDIILDDGSHMMEDQIVSFETLFPYLNDGGVYLCEDTHTSYWEDYNGKFHGKNTFIEYSKSFVDCVNYQHIREYEKCLPEYAESIGACYFCDSMVVIEKKAKRRSTSLFL